MLNGTCQGGEIPWYKLEERQVYSVVNWTRGCQRRGKAKVPNTIASMPMYGADFK